MTDRNHPFFQKCWRFVDGELDAEQESAFLASCEAEPDCYRELALALIERKRLTEILADFSNHAEAPQPLAIAKTGYKQNVAEPHSRANSSGLWRWLSALAATLLIGIFVGSASPHLFKATLVRQARPDAPAVLKDNVQTKTPPSLRDEETLVSLARHLKPTPTLNDETVQMLEESGLSVDRRNHIFLFEAADGYQIAIPAEFTFLRSDSK